MPYLLIPVMNQRTAVDIMDLFALCCFMMLDKDFVCHKLIFLR